MTPEFVFCDGINTDHLTESYQEQCPNSLLTSSNLRVHQQLTSRKELSNIFGDSSREDHIYIEPVKDGVSHHDAKLLVLMNVEF
jgi:hypothetical protein